MPGYGRDPKTGAILAQDRNAYLQAKKAKEDRAKYKALEDRVAILEKQQAQLLELLSKKDKTP